jgi:hypothetical protein
VTSATACGTGSESLLNVEREHGSDQRRARVDYSGNRVHSASNGLQHADAAEGYPGVESDGAYAMSLTGFDGSGPVGVEGSFTSDGAGHVTAGLQDINSTGGSGVQLAVPVTTIPRAALPL